MCGVKARRSPGRVRGSTCLILSSRKLPWGVRHYPGSRRHHLFAMTFYIAHNVQVIANNNQFESHSPLSLQLPQHML